MNLNEVVGEIVERRGSRVILKVAHYPILEYGFERVDLEYGFERVDFGSFLKGRGFQPRRTRTK
jgi:hypothetical protein